MRNPLVESKRPALSWKLSRATEGFAETSIRRICVLPSLSSQIYVLRHVSDVRVWWLLAGFMFHPILKESHIPVGAPQAKVLLGQRCPAGSLPSCPVRVTHPIFWAPRNVFLTKTKAWSRLAGLGK